LTSATGWHNSAAEFAAEDSRPALSTSAPQDRAGCNVGWLTTCEGARSKTIASVLGQKTVQMAEHYSEQFDRKKRARAGAEILSLTLSQEQKEKEG
jgi:hypothetical protein